MLILVFLLGIDYLRAETHIHSNVSVSTLEGVEFNGLVSDMKADRDGSTLLVLDHHALWRLDPLSKTKTLIAGSSTPGYTEGVGAAAQFNHPRGLLVTQNKAVISDSSNHCVREINLISRQTSHLAGTCLFEGFNGGSTVQAQFYYPFGLLGYKSGVLVVDYGNHAVRLVKGGKVSTIVRGSYSDPLRYPNYLTEMEGEVFMATDSGLLKLDIDSKSIELIAGTESSRDFSDGPLHSARFNHAYGLVSPAPGLLLIMDYHNDRVRLVNLVSKKVSSICTGGRGIIDGSGEMCQLYRPWSVEILGKTVYIGQNDGQVRMMPLKSFTENCPPTDIEVILEGDQDFASVNLSDVEVRAPLGKSQIITRLTDGTICTTTINVTESVKLICPTSIHIQLPPGETSANVSWIEPNAVGDPTSECLLCPPNAQALPAGFHKIEYEVLHIPTNDISSCSFDVVVMPDLTLQHCASDTTPIRDSVNLSIAYPVTCSRLDTMSWAIINSLLLHHYTDIIGLCQECELPRAPDSPDIHCDADVLTVNWKTNVKLTNQSSEDWPVTKCALTSVLMRLQESELDSTGRFMELTIITFSPDPFVTPVKRSNGLYLTPLVVSTCPQPEMIYDENDDRCYMPTK